MKSMNRQFKQYTSVIAVIVLVAVSTAQLSSVGPFNGNVLYAYSTNSQAQAHNSECEYDGSSGIKCEFNRSRNQTQSHNNECEDDGSSGIKCEFKGPVYSGNTTAVTTPPSQRSAPQGPPGLLGNDSSQTIGIPHDEYNTKMQEVLKNALED